MQRTPLVIRNDQQLAAALERTEALAGCIDDSEEEREFKELTDAIELYTETMRVLRMVSNDPHKTSEYASDD